MAEAVNHLEYSFPEREGNIWPSRAIRDVNDKLMRSKIDGLEVETTSSIRSELSELRVDGLLRSNFRPIDAEAADCIDD